MKTLLLILVLTACGRHQEPPPMDLGDDDGDQRMNFEESEENKYVATVPMVGEIRGIFRLTTDRLINVGFKNELASKTSLDILTKVGDVLQGEHFAEWSKLMLDQKEKIPPEAPDTLKFEIILPDYDEREFFFAIDGRSIKRTSFQSKELLQKILAGTVNVTLRRNFYKSPFFNADSEESIKDKTYRVQVSDGTKNQISYVSREVSIDHLLRMLKIEAQEIKEKDLFEEQLTRRGWFYRKFSNGNVVLVKGDLRDFHRTYIGKFEHRTQVLQRENGNSLNTIEFRNRPGARFYYKLRNLTATRRSFSEWTRRSTHRSGGGGGGGREGGGGNFEISDCTNYYRKISAEEVVVPSLDEILPNLSISLPLKKEDWAVDTKGGYWFGMLDLEQESTSLALKNLPQSTYTVTGQYDLHCNGPRPRREAAFITNSEGKLSFELESFIEKNPE